MDEGNQWISPCLGEPARSEVVIGRKCSLFNCRGVVCLGCEASVGRLGWLQAGWLAVHACVSVCLCVCCVRPVVRASACASTERECTEAVESTYCTYAYCVRPRWIGGRTDRSLGLVIDLMDRTNQCRVYRAP